ncbi:hypothetical protein C4D60_Mb06t08150 [Musa balbisiana]|uniref:Lipid droplet-associated hydrolase n=1 Tax=Musa balbisiana TaxID=52838 RepID=A0A4S8ILI5_MUSBA|nr:hypothetical protein C4D60_Mb06t08150 [Musa balbisiana]
MWVVHSPDVAVRHAFSPSPHNLLSKITACYRSIRKDISPRCSGSMDRLTLSHCGRKQATVRTCTVSGFPTELLEMRSEESSLHVLLIPGNPGIVLYYKDFVEAIYQLLEGQASVTGKDYQLGHFKQLGIFVMQQSILEYLSCSKVDEYDFFTRIGSMEGCFHWKNKLIIRKISFMLPVCFFSLIQYVYSTFQVDFIEQEYQNSEHPLILVGHSIGSYICLDIFKRLQQQVKYVIGLYPFLSLNKNSLKQSMIGLISRSSIVSTTISYFVSFLGSLPTWVQVAMVRKCLGQSWSSTAVDATCSHLLQYHMMRNMLFMAMTEFEKLSEEPDWMFVKKKHNQISLLFGIDDHWGPLSLFEEVSRMVPGLALSIEREGHMHSFCCTEAGSLWAGHHVATLIKNQIAK